MGVQLDVAHLEGAGRVTLSNEAKSDLQNVMNLEVLFEAKRLRPAQLRKRRKEVRETLLALYELLNDQLDGDRLLIFDLFRPSQREQAFAFRAQLKELADHLGAFPKSKPGRPQERNFKLLLYDLHQIYERVRAGNKRTGAHWHQDRGAFQGSRLDFVCEVLNQVEKAGGHSYSRNTVAQILKNDMPGRTEKRRKPIARAK
jgi:hypothetical protein